MTLHPQGPWSSLQTQAQALKLLLPADFPPACGAQAQTAIGTLLVFETGKLIVTPHEHRCSAPGLCLASRKKAMEVTKLNAALLFLYPSSALHRHHYIPSWIEKLLTGNQSEKERDLHYSKIEVTYCI